MKSASKPVRCGSATTGKDRPAVPVRRDSIPSVVKNAVNTPSPPSTSSSQQNLLLHHQQQLQQQQAAADSRRSQQCSKDLKLLMLQQQQQRQQEMCHHYHLYEEQQRQQQQQHCRPQQHFIPQQQQQQQQHITEQYHHRHQVDHRKSHQVSAQVNQHKYVTSRDIPPGAGGYATPSQIIHKHEGVVSQESQFPGGHVLVRYDGNSYYQPMGLAQKVVVKSQPCQYQDFCDHLGENKERVAAAVIQDAFRRYLLSRRFERLRTDEERAARLNRLHHNPSGECSHARWLGVIEERVKQGSHHAQSGCVSECDVNSMNLYPKSCQGSREREPVCTCGSSTNQFSVTVTRIDEYSTNKSSASINDVAQRGEEALQASGGSWYLDVSDDGSDVDTTTAAGAFDESSAAFEQVLEADDCDAKDESFGSSPDDEDDEGGLTPGGDGGRSYDSAASRTSTLRAGESCSGCASGKCFETYQGEGIVGGLTPEDASTAFVRYIVESFPTDQYSSQHDASIIPRRGSYGMIDCSGVPLRHHGRVSTSSPVWKQRGYGYIPSGDDVCMESLSSSSSLSSCRMSAVSDISSASMGETSSGIVDGVSSLGSGSTGGCGAACGGSRCGDQSCGSNDSVLGSNGSEMSASCSDVSCSSGSGTSLPTYQRTGSLGRDCYSTKDLTSRGLVSRGVMGDSSPVPRSSLNDLCYAANVTGVEGVDQNKGSQPVESGAQSGTQSMRVSDCVRKRVYRVGLNLFNKKPEQGINYLIMQRFVDHRPNAVARFLVSRKGLSKQMIGEYLGNIQNPFNMQVLAYFCNEIDLRGLQLDVALRKFQTYFRMPGEAQKIEKLMESFASRYSACNTDVVGRFNSVDTVFLLSFAIIMLNTDRHNRNIRQNRKMSLEDFIKNLRGVDGGKDIARDLLEGIYERISASELEPGTDHVSQVSRVEQMVIGKFPVLALPHRRLVCYCRLHEIQDINRKERLGSHQREIFLFNDILLVTKIASKKKDTVCYQFRNAFPLSGLAVYVFETSHYKYGVRLTNAADDRVLITMSTRSEHDRIKFVQDLKEAVLEVQELEAVMGGASYTKLSTYHTPDAQTRDSASSNRSANRISKDSGVIDVDQSNTSYRTGEEGSKLMPGHHSQSSSSSSSSSNDEHRLRTNSSESGDSGRASTSSECPAGKQMPSECSRHSQRVQSAKTCRGSNSSNS